ncbi:MAG: hypothetical protein EHM70_19050 [Chloroflexota bacterium]|nr:MAG: hypothetical protein EHM70_19050 [Chloroflexota bacterium]
MPLIGTSAYMAAPFSQSLVKGWTLDGGPPFPFLFAFLNGIFPPLTLAHAGSVALSFAILALLLLLTPRLRHPLAFLVLAVLLAAWGLVWESSYGLFAIGGVLVSLYLFWKWGEGARGFLKQEPLALMASVPLVLLQGGTITEIVRKVIFGASDSGIGVEGSVASTGFSLRWPPALLSSHFGPLNVFSPVEMAIAFFELGPILLLTPWITWWAWKRLRNGDWVVGALVASAWVGFIFPLFLEYQAERDISRLTGHSMLVWTLFLAIMLWEHAAGWQSYLRYAGAVALALMVFGGVVTTGIEFTAAYPPSLLGYELSGLDARIAKDHWDRLPEDAEVFDAGWWRASALTGRLTRVSIGGRDPIPTWDSLRKTPSVEQILANGYRYVYVDELWWGGLTAESQLSLSSPCVEVLGEYFDQEKERFRRLLDLEACKSQ